MNTSRRFIKGGAPWTTVAFYKVLEKDVLIGLILLIHWLLEGIFLFTDHIHQTYSSILTIKIMPNMRK
ncbi:MAG TPA: hypothetical protein VJL78_04610 [Candidatus Nitrosocosmicus sp.]|nr:hypothetical protein [Candidatus Nitrosocosmicus sp.]